MTESLQITGLLFSATIDTEILFLFPFLFVSSLSLSASGSQTWSDQKKLSYFRCGVEGCFSLSFFRGRAGEFAAATRMHIWAEWW